MKTIRYILAASLAASVISVNAFAVGNAVQGAAQGAEDLIQGAADGADDLLGDGSDENGSTPAEGSTPDESSTPEESSTPKQSDVSESTTTAPTNVNNAGSNKNPSTGVTLGLTALGAAAAGITAAAARKRK